MGRALGAVEAARDAYAGEVQELEALAAEREAQEQMAVADEREVLLATARRELAAIASEAAASRREVRALAAQVTRLWQELGVMQALLDDAERQGEAAEVRIETTLGAQINAALARAAKVRE